MTATSTTDLLPTEASSLLPDVGADLQEDDEDAAGYAAMMSELPTIVSMSGLLLDGDFDELHEIQNLLAPTTGDAEAEATYEEATNEHAPAAVNDYEEATSDAYIQSLVPNPIPSGDCFFSREDPGCSANPPPLVDSGSGIPSTLLLETAATTWDSPTHESFPVNENQDDNTTSNVSRSVPAAKRVYHEVKPGVVSPRGVANPILEPCTKKMKLECNTESESNLAQTPATIRTSLDGVSAPNPLLFGRPIQFPCETKLEPNNKSTKAMKVTLKPRANRRSSKDNHQQMKLSKRGVEAHGESLGGVNLNKKFLVPVPILSYSIPTTFAEKFSETCKPRLCKLVVKGNVEPTVVSAEAAIAFVAAPPRQDLVPMLNLSDISATRQNSTSATASKKKVTSASKMKKSPTKNANKKDTALKAKKGAVSKNTLPKAIAVNLNSTDVSKLSQVNISSTCTESSTTATSVSAVKLPEVSFPNEEKLMVANPLANVPPAEPFKPSVPYSKPKTTAATTETKLDASSPETTQIPVPPVIVSSNSSAASSTENPNENDMMLEDPALESPANTAAISDKSAKTSGSKPRSAKERAQACRDRNRQHARNTRLRKKAYVEELKKSLLEMVEERDKELASVQEEEALAEQRRTARKQVLQEFLKMRGHNERDPAKWERVMQDPVAFVLNLPITKFQTMVNETTSKAGAATGQVLVGVQDVMADASYFASFLQSLGTTGDKNDETGIDNEKIPVYFEYSCDDSKPLMDGTTTILSWRASSRGGVSKGAKTELSLVGTIKAEFCPNTNKLVSATIMFDTGAIRAQLPQSHHHYH